VNTPLRFIRIRHSDYPWLAAGQCFDTLTDFDATLRQARRLHTELDTEGASGFIHFVIAWKDGASFHGRYDLERPAVEGVVEHVIAACRSALADARLHVLLDAARLTVLRLEQAVCAERGISMGAHPGPGPGLEVQCFPA